MFCSKCGKEMPKEVIFCPFCGNRSEDKLMEMRQKKNRKKKWILPTVLAVAAVVVIVAGVVMAYYFDLFVTDEERLEAFKEFYHEYYGENADYEDEEGSFYDCAGRMQLGPNGELYMSISDIVFVNGDQIQEELHLFEYKRGKVVEKAKIPNLTGKKGDWARGMMIVLDGNLYYICGKETDSSSTCTQFFRFNEDKFEKEEWEVDIEDLSETIYGISVQKWIIVMGGVVDTPLIYDWILCHSPNMVSGKSFERVLDAFMNEKVEDALQLQFVYMEILKELGIRDSLHQQVEIPYTISDLPESSAVAVVEKGAGYYTLMTNGDVELTYVADGELSDIRKVLGEVQGRNVNRIGKNAFSGCQNLETAVIPEQVIYIEERAFWGCTVLKQVLIPEGVTEIKDSTFARCFALEEVHIPDGITSIGDSAFQECVALKDVRIPDSVTSIGDSAFLGCTSLRDVWIPSGVTEIGGNIFGKQGEEPIIIYCEKGSKVEAYARENGYYVVIGNINSYTQEERDKFRKEMMWKQAYLERIRSGGSDQITGYALYDLNQDGIPEVFYGTEEYDSGGRVKIYVLSFDKRTDTVVENSFDHWGEGAGSVIGTKLVSQISNLQGYRVEIFSLDENGKLRKEGEAGELHAPPANDYEDFRTVYLLNEREDVTEEEYTRFWTGLYQSEGINNYEEYWLSTDLSYDEVTLEIKNYIQKQ